MFLIAPLAAILSLVAAYLFFQRMMRADAGNAVMQSIAGAVREGAFAYLRRQYGVVAIVFAVLLVILSGLAFFGVVNAFTPLAFLSGGLGSGLAGFIGMNAATRASSRTAQGCSEGLNRGLRVGFTSGAVMGLSVVGLALLDISIWFVILSTLIYTPQHLAEGLQFAGMTLVASGPGWVEDGVLTAAGERAKWTGIASTMVTFGIGASLQALFARVGGGIYTKAADVGADLVGKVEAGIPEDDPRNPATIADNVGDNVGDVAGMGADLFESYYSSILAAAALGAALPAWFFLGSGLESAHTVQAPMVLAGLGIIASIIGTLVVRTKEGARQKDLLHSLLMGTALAGALVLVGAAGMALIGVLTWGLVGAVAAGLIAGIIIGQSTEYYTAGAYSPTKSIADAARMGPATTIISGVGVGMRSTGIPVLTVVAAIIIAYACAGGFSEQSNAVLAGLYGISLAAVGMLSTLGITLATDAYGPIADNAGGNAEMAGLDPQVRQRTDALDALGNTTAATGKGFAIGSAALTALALLATYVQLVLVWLQRAVDPELGYIVRGELAFAVDAVAATRALSEEAAARAVTFADAGLADVMTAYNLTIINPVLMAGLFIGGVATFVFTALTMQAVGRAAGHMVEEVRRQFREIPGIMEYRPGDESEENRRRTPDYARCVAIATASAQTEMIVPAALAVTLPVAVGLVFGVAGVLGLLAGALVAGFPLACFLNNAGGAWDNAKKSIEEGAHGGKYLKNKAGEYVNERGELVANREDAKNPVHGATVIGDTVGDPFKDTSGPALNILIKLMAVVSVVFCGLTVAAGLL
ncbi:MAG: sodium-translocating pyrophosphatase [Planctomycetota bacterium]|nr:MAG: sodium-translocating pyrophosphatase [Planctomycetota bacterium]